MKKKYVISTKEGLGTFRFDMTRQEIWSQDRSPIMCYFPQNESKVRSDDFTLLGIFVHYDQYEERVNQFSVFTKVRSRNAIEVVLFDEVVNDFQRRDVKALLELNDCNFEDAGDSILCKEHGLVFGFVDDDDIESSCHSLDYINIFRSEDDLLKSR